jgi:ParB family transcriptional regulator, chromosome partitioning protein
MGKLSDIDEAMTAATSTVKPLPARPGAMPFVAKLAAGAAQGLLAENNQLKAERESGGVILLIDPKVIAPSSFANRDARSLDAADPDLQDLVASFQKVGQLQPITVRPAPPGGKFAYEIVFGHRRHAAALFLDASTENGWPAKACLDVKAADAKVHVLQMFGENSARKELSPFETGAMFANWLHQKVFATQVELADAAKLSEAAVSQYLRLAEMPEPMLRAFGDPRLISMRWMQELTKALKENRTAVLECATRLAKLEAPLNPEAVLRNLVAAASTEQRRPAATREESVKIQGKVALKLSRKEGRLTLKVGKMVDKQLQREFAEEVKDFATAWLTKRLRAK